MDKPEARKILVRVGYFLNEKGFTAEEYKEILETRNNLKDYDELFEAYETVKEEIDHVLAWCWTFTR